MSQLTNFSGGLNTRYTPHLISIDQSVKCENVNPSAISLKPMADDDDELQNFGANSSFFYFAGAWIARSGATDYVEFQDVLYYSDGISIPQKTVDGTNFYNVGITTPTTKPTVVANDAVDPDNKDVRQYCYTYYNANDTTESVPSPYSLELDVSTDNVDISGFIASTDTQVTHIRIYRLGGNLSNMTLVASIANTVPQTYTDISSDLDIASEHQLDSFNAGQALAGLLFLTEYNAMLFGAIDDKLYYSEVGKPNEWSAFSFLDFDYPITGLGATQNGLLVFTKSRTHLITGNAPAALNKVLIHASQGCINHKTIKYVDNLLIWLSQDGLCTSNGGSVQVITLDKLDKLVVTSLDAEILDNQYYLFHNTETLVVDFRYGPPTFRTIDLIANGAWYSEQFDRLYYVDVLGNLYSLGRGESTRTYNYKTGRLTEGSISNLKNYRTIYVYILGTAEMKSYIDGVLVSTINLTNGQNEVKLPQQKRQGYYIEFEFTGTGEVLEVEYKLEGRQNGR